MGGRWGVLLGAVLGLGSGCKNDAEPPPDGMGGMGGGGSSSAWTKVELEGAVCADGSQYKFFVKEAEQSAGLVITLEPGGACWDYKTCGGDGEGTRAANLRGIADEHMMAMPPPLGTDPDGIPWGLMFPHLGISGRGGPTASYDQVYLPYCTGDAFLGDFAATYPSADGDDELEIEHRGAANLALVTTWLTGAFPSPEHLLVVGSSAGGLGASFHYAALRDAVTPGRSSFVNDSGPVFPPGGPQSSARQAFAERWHTDAFLSALDERLGASAEQSLVADSGHLTALLAAAFPEDRFLVTHFLSDLDNSHFAYGELFEEPTVEQLQDLWLEDTDLLIGVIEGTDNWGYYFPGFRPDNCSHCVALLPVDELNDTAYVLGAIAGTANPYLRTELGDSTFATALESVLSEGGDLVRERAPEAMTDFTEAQAAACLDR